MLFFCFLSVYGDHRYLHVRTHSFPTRRSSDLIGEQIECAVRRSQPVEAGLRQPLQQQRAILGIAVHVGVELMTAIEHRDRRVLRQGRRSEEHTSELQSLMRISYAVFCLKKKTTTYSTQKHDNNRSYQT